MQRARRYRAEGLSPVIRIAGDGRLEAALGRIMVGWTLLPAGPADAEAGAPAALCVEQRGEVWTCSGVAGGAPARYHDPVATGCSVIANLFKAQTLEDRDWLCLHAAGVRFGGGLAVLTGDYRAGKSLLTAACCAAGAQAFSDDIIPLVPCGSPCGLAARAPGLALRLRLPLPHAISAGTRDFLAAHRVLESKRYLYVRPPRARLAGHGEEAPIRAVVSLRRSESAAARLEALAPGDALSELVRRNFARETPAGRILDVLDGLVSAVPCLRLTYRDADDAAALLRQALAPGSLGSPVPVPPAPPLPPGAAAPARAARQAPPLAAGTVIRRGAGVAMRERGGQTFLTDPAELVIFHLNPTGSAVWRVIERPIGIGELVELFSAAFPERPPEHLSADLSGLIGDLAESGLICLDAGRGDAER